MEKQAKYQDKILKFLPRAASVIIFQNPPFSPNRDNRNASKQVKLAHGRGFSGPIFSMIPDEARRKPKNGSYGDQEPTSPKISCMGQIKHSNKKKMMKKNDNTKNKRVSEVPEAKPGTWSPRDVKKHASAIKRIFMSGSNGRKSNASSSVDDDDRRNKSTLTDRAASLSQMKRFASGRSDPFANFDWAAAQVTPVEDSDHQSIYYSDRERSDQEDEEEEDDGEESMIPFSAPVVVAEGVALQPRKEINLWKRRTMAPPTPLEIRAN